MKIGVFIGRMQPMHLGHQKIINESINKNDYTFIILGSSGLINEYNPFNDEERKKFINHVFDDYKNYKIKYLQDTKSDEEWVKNIEKLIKNDLKENIKQITFYGGDFENDYAIKVLKDYYDILDFDYILFEEISRKILLVEHNGENKYISSTLVREALGNNDIELLEKLLDESVFKSIYRD